MEQELLTLPEHLRSPLVFSVGSCVYGLYIVVCPFVLCLLAVVVSVHL